MPDALPTAAETAYRDAQNAAETYAAQVHAQHHEQHPDPIGRDGQPRWSEEQALLRTAAWTEAENAELERLRGEASAALRGLLDERAASSS